MYAYIYEGAYLFLRPFLRWAETTEEDPPEPALKPPAEKEGRGVVAAPAPKFGVPRAPRESPAGAGAAGLAGLDFSTPFVDSPNWNPPFPASARAAPMIDWEASGGPEALGVGTVGTSVG